MLSMPVLGPSLKSNPPETEQVNLAVQAVDLILLACPSLVHLVSSQAYIPKILLLFTQISPSC